MVISKEITALIYNYPPEIKAAVQISKGSRDIAEKTLHTGSSKTITLNLTGLKPNSTFEIEILDENNGNILKKWMEMGMPDPATREQTIQLKAYAMATKKYTVKADKKGNLVWNETLLPWAVAVLKQIK